VNDLNERLNEALDEITPRPAPVAGAIRHGKRIQWRRRAVAGAGVAAVVAAAVIIPRSLHVTAAPPPTGGQYTVTVQPPSPHAPAGQIATGTVNGMHWALSLQPCPSSGSHQMYCFTTLSDDRQMQGLESVDKALILNDGTTPVSLGDLGEPRYQLRYGAVRTDVTYLKVYLGNGTVLTLRPLLVDGFRMVAFAAPAGVQMTVTAYGSAGEIATATPFVQPGQAAVFNTWLRPGQPGLPVSDGVIGSGANWTAKAYIGPWGICLSGSAGDSTCFTPSGALTTGVLAISGGDKQVVFGSATPQVARMVFTLPHGQAVTVRPVTVGGYRFIAFSAPADKSGMTWTAYDDTGKVVATGS